MKIIQTEYSENSVTYWPVYKEGKIGIILSAIFGMLCVALGILILLDNSSKGTKLTILAALLIVIFVLLVGIRYIYRIMYMKIIVSDTEITYCKNNTADKKQILWENVESVYFNQDLWYGRKSLKIFCRKSENQKSAEKDICDCVLPVNAVDEQKLLQLIPNHLWKNQPWWA